MKLADGSSGIEDGSVSILDAVVAMVLVVELLIDLGIAVESLDNWEIKLLNI